jgi:hypothetical protein
LGGATLTIIIEDGSIVTGANSYVSEADLTAYATARGVTLSGSTEQLLIQAMDYIESQQFLGKKLTQAQPLQWPRSGVYIDGYSVSSSTIPNELKTALMATAVSVDEGNSPLSISEQAVKREKVDVIEVEYQDGSSATTYDPRITASLKKLTIGGGSMFNPVVTRA